MPYKNASCGEVHQKCLLKGSWDGGCCIHDARAIAFPNTAWTDMACRKDMALHDV